MATNPNYNWDAWNEVSTVQEQMKELYSLINLMWCHAKDDEDLRTTLSGLMTFTSMIRTRVNDIENMVGPKIKPI